MNDRYSQVTEDELHAYVDGELPADRLSAVETWLATHPDDMAQVAAWRAQMEAIRARYGALATEPVPPRFDLAKLARGGRPWRAIATAATIAAFVVGGVVGWAAHGVTAPASGGFQAFTKDALEAHQLYVVEVRHPVEVPGSEATHLVQWLSKRVGYTLRAPNLEKMGLHLVGGRLLPGPTGAAAFLMYENASGERYTIYCARAKSPPTAMRYDAAKKVGAFYWVDGDLAYVVSGEADRSHLWKVAEAAYEQFDLRNPGKGS